MRVHFRTLLGEIQFLIVLISMVIIVSLAAGSLIIVSYCMLADLRARSITTADEIQTLLEYPLYVVDNEQAINIGKTFLASGKISGILLKSSANGILIADMTGTSSPRIPEISRDIFHNGILVGKFSVTFSDKEIIYIQSRFGAITFLIILAVLLANIAANRYLIAPKVRMPYTSALSALKKMAEGEYETKMTDTPYRDLNTLVSHFNDMASKINQNNIDLQESEFRFKAFFDMAPFSCVVTDLEGRYRMVNSVFINQFGLYEIEVIGHTENEIGIYTDHAQSEYIRNRLLTAGEIHNHETVIHYPQGYRHVLYSSRVIEFRGEQLVLSATIDITERKRAEVEKEKLHSQLLQAQKMESVGRLAGGVAHDFNNMLTVILGHSQLAMINCNSNDPIYSDLKVIEETTLRSADLVRQLLAFARKQTIHPKILDLNDSISNMFIILERLIGEHIDIVRKHDKNLWLVKIDPTQIDQIVLNLCVNARDAIIDTGQIKIETRNVVLDENYCKINPDTIPGEYVMLAVNDNGCGMDKDVIDHIFEPFYTTKETGKGSGMGLATIYGIARQNDGFINLSSEPDKGTTFRVFLPRSVENQKAHTEKILTETIVGNGETILLVEDELVILDVGKSMLERLGYTVLTANKPSEALLKAQEHVDQLKLLVTDVIMPEMNGSELEKMIRKIKPDLKCLFISGYTDNSIVHHGVLNEDVSFLQKPFSMNSLATKVKEALES